MNWRKIRATNINTLNESLRKDKLLYIFRAIFKYRHKWPLKYYQNSKRRMQLHLNEHGNSQIKLTAVYVEIKPTRVKLQIG